jgi:hypothetical protein
MTDVCHLHQANPYEISADDSGPVLHVTESG